MSTPQNYMVHVKCPHCSTALVVAISGFGGELATRIKQCKKCGAEFYVHLIAQASINQSVSDGEISALRSRIAYLRDERKRNKAEILIRYEQARRLLDEAMNDAREMRDKAGAN